MANVFFVFPALPLIHRTILSERCYAVHFRLIFEKNIIFR